MKHGTVIHLVDDYLPRSQTFIYQYLSKMRAVHPVVITQNPSNLDLFPLNNVAVISQHQWMYKLRERLIMRLAVDFLPLTNQYVDISRQYKGDILHAHFGHVGYRALELRRKTNLPLVTTFYGFDMSILPRRKVWRRAYASLFANGELFLVEGERMAKELNALGCAQEKIIIQPIAIDLSKITFKPRSWAENSPVYILMAGRFVEKKGFTYAIRAFAQIASKWPSVEMRIIGDGPLKKEIETEIAKSGLAKRIHLLGSLDYTAYLAEATRGHLFMSPSVTARNGDSEGGAPTTLLEMQAAGLPVLSTFHADIPNVVKDGITGFLVGERDVTALAERLDWLLRHPNSWQAIGAEGHKYICEAHNIHTQVTRLENLYLRMVSEIPLSHPSVM